MDGSIQLTGALKWGGFALEEDGHLTFTDGGVDLLRMQDQDIQLDQDTTVNGELSATAWKSPLEGSW